MVSDVKWVSFSVKTSREASDAISDMLIGFGANGVSVSDPKDILDIIGDPGSLVYADDEFLSSLGSDVVINAYFPVSGKHIRIAKQSGNPGCVTLGDDLYSSAPEIKISIAEFTDRISDQILRIKEFLPVGKAEISWEIVREKDWEENWKKDYKPIHISDRITICPSWEKASAVQGEMIVYLDPGSAFGTGSHETTAMCSEIIDGILRANDRILDLGCGSGILAIIASKIGAEWVEAIDIDPTAVAVARKNISANGADVILKEGVLSDATRNDYSLIIANIIANVLIDLRDDFPKFMCENGRLLISGIIDIQKERVLNAYKDAGYELLRSVHKGDWYSFLFRKGPGQKREQHPDRP